ncbi:MAG TPA: hypothetical protein VND95_12780, partial [Stellaceae bacterium]|nr:hypothetical protein [Stellaceae bacterium]
MLGRRAFVAGAALFGASLRARPAVARNAGARDAGARDAAVRVSRPLDLVALPLIVMQHEHLIERVAEAMGLGRVSVIWTAPDK